VSVDGIRMNNPAWRPTTACIVGTTMPFTNKSTALAVVSSAPPLPVASDNGDREEEEIVVTPLYVQAAEQFRNEYEQEIIVEPEDHGGSGGAGDKNGGSGGAGQQDSLSAGQRGLEQLNQVLAKYEVPFGLLSKLLRLKEFDVAEIIVDDSGSMNLPSDAKGPNGEALTRWMEARWRILQMMEIMAYVVTSPPVYVRYLNRPDVVEFRRGSGESPKAYGERVDRELERAFLGRGPSGTTPALEAIRASFARYPPDRAVLRYFMGDGVPNGFDVACREIEYLLMHRANPSKNPFTFMSCTNEDEQTEWMKECEEKAPYCAEYDDYGDESREILKDQGKAFPYSYGLHLVAQIVGAFNPDDLDAMDESVPFTKQTLDNLLGYRSSPREYRYYFDGFLTAQRQLPLKPYQRSFVNQLPALYPQFEAVPVAKSIAQVSEYRQNVKSRQQQHQQHQYAQRSQQPSSGECCVIL